MPFFYVCLYTFAHSRGGAYLATALKLMKPEELKVIHASTYGSASLFNDIGLGSLEHYIAKGDPVPMTDPCNYLKGYLFHSPNVYFLQGQGSFWTRHSVLESTYATKIEDMAHRILRMIGE